MHVFTKLLLYLLLLGSLHHSFAQSRGYIIINSDDSTIYKQGWLDDAAGNDPKYVFFRRLPDIASERYAVDSITEFGFNGGRKWVRKEIADSKQFLEGIQSGKLNLFSNYNGTQEVFFIEQDDTLLTLNSASFTASLKTYVTGCSLLEGEINHLKYERKSLNFLVRNYNNGKCVPIPFADFGIGIGINISRLKASETNLSNLISGGVTANATSLALVAYWDIPVWKVNNFSLYNELSFGTVKYKKNKNHPS